VLFRSATKNILNQHKVHFSNDFDAAPKSKYNQANLPNSQLKNYGFIDESDTQSCVSMRLNNCIVPATSYYQGNGSHLSHLFTPRFVRKQFANTEQLAQPKKDSQVNLSNYLTWKSFNCNPTMQNYSISQNYDTMPSDPNRSVKQADKENKIKSDQNYSQLQFLKSRQNPKAQRSTQETFAAAYEETMKSKSMSTPVTPNLSGLTTHRKNTIANRAPQISEDKTPKSYETRVAEYLLKNNLTLPKNNETSSIEPKPKEIVPLENALANMNEVLKNLTTRDNDIEALKNIIKSFENDKVLNSAGSSFNATQLSQLSPTPSLTSSSMSDFSKQSTMSSDQNSKSSCNSSCIAPGISVRIPHNIPSSIAKETTKIEQSQRDAKKKESSSFSSTLTRKIRRFFSSDARVTKSKRSVSIDPTSKKDSKNASKRNYDENLRDLTIRQNFEQTLK